MATQKFRDHPAIKRTGDGYSIQYKALHVDPGWNVRTSGPELDEHIEQIAAAINGGTRVPPLQIYLNSEGEPTIVDGHCRHAAYGRLLERGVDVGLVAVSEFAGNDADRIAYMFTSSQGKGLTQYEQSLAFQRLVSLGWTPAEIAKKTGKTPSYVSSMLVVANANTDVHTLVKAGEVSVGAAVRTVRKSGEKAGAVLKAKVNAAKAAAPGKKVKITEKDIDPNRLSPEAVAAVREFFIDLNIHLGSVAYNAAVKNLDSPPEVTDGFDVSLPLTNVVALVRLQQYFTE